MPLQYVGIREAGAVAQLTLAQFLALDSQTRTMLLAAELVDFWDEAGDTVPFDGALQELEPHLLPPLEGGLREDAFAVKVTTNAGETFEGFTLAVARNGLRLRCSQSLPVGERVVVSFVTFGFDRAATVVGSAATRSADGLAIVLAAEFRSGAVRRPGLRSGIVPVLRLGEHDEAAQVAS
jgi:hypothetical protein